MVEPKDKLKVDGKSRNSLDGEIVTVHKGIAIYKTKASPYWFARVRDPKEGKYVVRSTKEKAQISARRRAEELAAEVLGGHKPTPKEYSFKYYATRFVQKGSRDREAITVKKLVERFLADHVEEKRKSKTATHYRSVLEGYLVPKYGSKKAQELSRADMAKLHLEIKHAPYQANRLLAVVASMYSFGDKHGLTPEDFNPAKKIERFPETRRERFF